MEGRQAAPLHREQSRGEEIANSVSHGLALVAAFIGIPFLLAHAARQASAGYIVGTSVFSATIILLYLASTLYHALPAGKAKRVFRILEHSAIYLLIAGTYTPFTLGVLSGAWGWTLFGIIWGLAVIGIVIDALPSKGHRILPVVIYLLMGWSCLAAIRPLLRALPVAGFMWLLAGGLFYTVGVIFFALDARVRHFHGVWHLFVLAGSLSHYCAVLFYVV